MRMLYGMTRHQKTTAASTATAFRVEFSIYGANPTPAWRKAIVSSVVVYAADATQAREIAGYGDATRSVVPA